MNSISIIIAIYNRRDELFELLSSVLRQTDKNFEIIVVDDGSQIDLSPTIKIFENQLDIHFYRKNNSGPGLTRNY
ncbi:MAG: glycosyltransferase family 2 protein, partial [Soonwooa sp.]